MTIDEALLTFSMNGKKNMNFLIHEVKKKWLTDSFKCFEKFIRILNIENKKLIRINELNVIEQNWTFFIFQINFIHLPTELSSWMSKLYDGGATVRNVNAFCHINLLSGLSHQ